MPSDHGHTCSINFYLSEMKFAVRILILLLSTYIFSKSLHYFGFRVTGILADKGELLNSFLYQLVFYIHVAFGSVALLLGPWQFFKRLRTKRRRLHRILGKVYVFSCLLGAIAGFCLAFFATGGPIGKMGFAFAGIFWFLPTYLAYQKVVIGDIVSHEKWMIASFAMTFAAVTLRVWLGILIGVFGLSYIHAYEVVAWLSWVPNLFVAFLVIQRMHLKTLKTQNN